MKAPNNRLLTRLKKYTINLGSTILQIIISLLPVIENLSAKLQWMFIIQNLKLIATCKMFNKNTSLAQNHRIKIRT